MLLPIESCHVPQISLTCCSGCCDTCTLHFYGVTFMVTTTWNKGAEKTLGFSVVGFWIPINSDSLLSKGRASLPGYFSILHEEGPACLPIHHALAFGGAPSLLHSLVPKCCLGTLLGQSAALAPCTALVQRDLSRGHPGSVIVS